MPPSPSTPPSPPSPTGLNEEENSISIMDVFTKLTNYLINGESDKFIEVYTALPMKIQTLYAKMPTNTYMPNAKLESPITEGDDKKDV